MNNIREKHPRIRKEQNFFSSGQIKSEVTYLGEHIEGTTRRWYENGVLKEEIPMRQSRVHGVVRRWDRRGILLDEGEFTDGTGVLRTWSDEGHLEGEMFVREGVPHGRMRAWDEEGELLVEQYFISGKKVSRKAYVKACMTDSTLPNFGDDVREPVQTIVTSNAPGIDIFHKSIEEFPDAEKAEEWLRASTAEYPRTLGEFSSTEESLDLVKEFVKKGASNVFVVKITTDDDGSLNSGHLLVEVPLESRKRKTVLDMANEINESQGFPRGDDSGQLFVLVSLD